MGQRNIDFGTYPDDPSADAIRTAFEKVQQNFDQVFNQLEAAAVTSVNKTPGAGITVNQPTGNVVITANIACLQVSTSTLSIGRDANGGNTALITTSSQVLVLDLPDTISNVTNIELDGNADVAGNIIANNITANTNLSVGNSVTISNNLTVTNFANASRFVSTVANGTAPITVTSQTKVTNLNADLVDGYDASQTALANTIVVRDADANVVANSFIGNLVGSFANGNSNVSIPAANGNVNISAVGNANILVVTGTGINVAGTLNATGNANIGNIGVTTATITTGNITTINSGLLQNGTSNITLDSGGNISTFIGGNATAQLIVTATGANIAGTANITGNANVGNLGATQVYASANITAPVLVSNVSTGTAPLTVTSTTRVSNLNVAHANVADFINVNTVTGGSYYIVLADNVTGNVTEAANANLTFDATTGNLAATLLTGTLTTSAQPNVTSVGTLTNLSVSGNITAGNANLGNLAAANYVQGTLTTAAQPNITSVGNLNGLTVAGNILPAANVTYSLGNSTYQWQDLWLAGNTLYIGGAEINIVGNDMVLTNPIGGQIIVSGTGISLSNTIQNGNSNVEVYANSDVTVSVGGNSNVLVFTPTGANITGYLTVTGNIQAGNTELGNIANANFLNVNNNANVTQNIIAGNVYANSGEVKAQYLIGDGSNISNISVAAGSYIVNGNSNVSVSANANVNFTVAGNNVANITGTGANITGTLNVSGNANVGNIEATNFVGGNFTGNVTTSAQGNITSLGTLTGLTVNGVSDLGAIGNVRISGGSNNQVLVATGTGSNLAFVTTTGLTFAPGANTQILFNDDGNFAANSNLTFNKTTGVLTVGGNISAGNVSGGNTVTANYITGTLTTAAQPNITSIGTLTSPLIVQANLNAGNTVVSGGTITSNVHALTILQTWNNSSVRFSALEANITDTSSAANSLLLDLQISNVSKFAVSKEGNIFYSGVITGNGSGLSAIAGANVTGTVANATYATSAGSAGSATTAGTVTTNAQPNITSVGTLSSLAVTGNVTAGNVYANTGIIGAQTLRGEGGNISNIQGANVSGAVSSATSATTAGTVTTAAQPNITSVGTLTSLGVNGTITAVNITANTGVFTGNGNGLSSLQASNIIGTVSTATSATNASALLQNTSTATTVYPTFTTSGANGNSSAVINTSISANLGNASITATTFVGALSGAATTAGTVTTAAQPNITSVGTLTSLTTSGNISGANVSVTGYHIRSVGTGISANGSNQGTATALTKEINIISTVSSGQGVVLPTAVAGMVLTITNTSANSVFVYPASGAAINSLATNTEMPMVAGATLQFIAPSSTQWYTVGATFA